ALFDHKHQNLQTIFKQAIHQHNSNASLKFIVETAQEFVDHNDPTRVVRQLQCLHFNRGIYAFLAPHFEAYAYKSALSFANTYRVPLVGSSPLFPHHEKTHFTLIAYHIQDTAMERHTFHYLLTNLVLSDSWSKEVPAAFNAVNITSFALPSDRNELRKLIQMKTSSANAVIEEEKTPTLEESLALDSTRVLLQAFNLIIQSQINITKALETESVVSTVNFTRKVIDPTCPTLKPFKFGEIIASHLKITSMNGITGNIEFHSTGLRKNYTIEVFEITNNGNFEKEEPFLMLKKDNSLSGNDRFEGFAADLMASIADTLELQYKIQLVNDSKYGVFDGKSSWSGMIGQLIRHEVHMAIAPLTITNERASVVDFSHPFMTSDITMMFKKPSSGPQDMFPFVRPLSKEVWAAIVLAVFVVTVIFYVVSKLSHDRNVTETNQSEGISLCSSLSYSVGVLVYQVSGIYPHSVSSRIVSSVWWLFVFIVVTSYLSNLTANSVLTKMKFTLYHITGKYETISDGFLYYDQMPVPISSFDDLAKQNVIKYGLLRNSSTQTFFKESQNPAVSRMWATIEARDDLLVDTYSEGVKKVRESDGQYVFIMESPANDYLNDRQPCNTYKVGKHLNIVEYGIALPRGSPLRDKVNLAILMLKDKGVITMLKDRWWRDRSQCKYLDV
ncbi:unnamed protein product, partial [Medioppia subpectinata]